MISSCSFQNDDNLISGIYPKSNWDHNGILFLTESAVVWPMRGNELDSFLTPEEKNLATTLISDSNEYRIVASDTFRDYLVEYKDYSMLVESDSFIIRLLYFTDSRHLDRCRHFILRSYNKYSNQIISTIPYATWCEENHEFISGEISSDMIISRKIESKLISTYTVDSIGNFILKLGPVG